MKKSYLLPFLATFLATLLLTCASGCGTFAQRNADPLGNSVSPSPASPPSPPARPLSTPTPASTPTGMSVTIYVVDSQCQALVPKQIQVPSDRPIEAAIGEVINQQPATEFALSGYRVQLQQGVATVDLRLATNTQRPMTALSSCEQLALFGSLKETLLKNPQWGITSVKFTERGKAIVL